MISVSIKNVPQGAYYWRPYFRDGIYGVGGGGKTYFPSNILDIDEGWECDMPAGLGKFFRVDLYNASRQIIYDYQTAFAGYVISDGKHYEYDYDMEWLKPSSVETKYFFTVARGENRAELEADSQGKEMYGAYRFVLETNNAPNWLLSSSAWIINTLKAPLRAIDVEITGAEIVGKSIYIYMGGHTPVIAIVLAVAAALAAVGLLIFFMGLKIQQEITKQLETKLEIANSTNSAAQAVLNDPDLSTEAKETIVNLIYGMGVEAMKTEALDKTGIEWNKYLTWGMIGAGIIAGAYFLIPRFRRN
jgi:hypothetical protein